VEDDARLTEAPPPPMRVVDAVDDAVDAGEVP
jgi:hypothetical protein